MIPQQARALGHHGNRMLIEGRLDEADNALQSAIALAPDDPRLYVLLARLRQDQGRRHEALELCDRTLFLQPGWPIAEFQRARALLALGRYEDGWEAYEARFAIERAARSLEASRLWHPRSPRWTGGPLTGRLLIYNDMPGFGDTFQFARYVPLLSRCAEVVVAVQAQLVEVLRDSPALHSVPVVPIGSEVDHCAHVALMSLPHVLNLPQPYCPSKPYLSAEPARVAAWRQRLGGNGLRVGVNWASKSASHQAAQRSFSLAALAPFAAVPGVRLASLQKCVGLDQLGELPPELIVEKLDGLDDGPNAFVDTAAVMMSLDLVISSDTAVAHLAGALGRPVWVALRSAPDWRWGLDRNDTPWYPTMRLFRQSAGSDWEAVFERMADELRSVTEYRALAEGLRRPGSA
jgi:hypothetical protein